MPRCGIIILVYLLYLARRVASDRDHFERPAANTDIVRSHAFCEFPSNMVNPQMLILCSWFYQIYALPAAWSLLQSGGCTRTAACSLILCTLQMIPGIPIHQVGCTRDMVRVEVSVGRCGLPGVLWTSWPSVGQSVFLRPHPLRYQVPTPSLSGYLSPTVLSFSYSAGHGRPTVTIRGMASMVLNRSRTASELRCHGKLLSENQICQQRDRC